VKRVKTNRIEPFRVFVVLLSRIAYFKCLTKGYNFEESV
jgi:hypothetical protein